MARTWNTVPIDPDRPEVGYDLDTTIVDGIESLEQRIAQRLRFTRGTDWVDSSLGTESIVGERLAPELATTIITDAIMDEGADEVISVLDVEYSLDRPTRGYRYRAEIESVYGPLTVSGTG